jgi:hypothetical protein
MLKNGSSIPMTIDGVAFSKIYEDFTGSFALLAVRLDFAGR